MGVGWVGGVDLCGLVVLTGGCKTNGAVMETQENTHTHTQWMCVCVCVCVCGRGSAAHAQ